MSGKVHAGLRESGGDRRCGEVGGGTTYADYDACHTLVDATIPLLGRVDSGDSGHNLGGCALMVVMALRSGVGVVSVDLGLGVSVWRHGTTYSLLFAQRFGYEH